jgi:hypothetical protein
VEWGWRGKFTSPIYFIVVSVGSIFF